MRILCCGLRQIDAGKTTFTSALLQYLREHDYDVCPFKPRAGNDIWYDWPMVKKSLEKGTIYGHDVSVLSPLATKPIQKEIISPTHRLWIPSNDDSGWKNVPQFLMDRINIGENQIVGINRTVDIPIEKKYFQKLFENSNMRDIKTRKDLQEITSLYDEADEWAHKKIRSHFENIVYESYTNVALPWEGIDRIDWVFAIRPFQAKLYDGERFLQSYEINSGIGLEADTSQIIEPLKPQMIIDIPPFRKNLSKNLQSYLKSYFKKIF